MHTLKVLIVEDESLIALELVQLLQSFGCQSVEFATHPKKVYQIIEQNTTNLILMDINLRSIMTGIELYKSLNTSIPVIFITAYNDEATIEKAIETNPLGYLIKPYGEDDLKALLILAKYKIKKHIKEHSEQNERLLLGEGYTFDTKNENLYSNDSYINLGIKELKLLKLLIDSQGDVINFQKIEYELWGKGSISGSSLRTLIYRLRGKLDDKLIETVYNQGIKLKDIIT
jgi:DNA-binding response OmpR family regulator